MLEAILNKRRYELQQKVLLNPNGLSIGTTNKFGIVDGSNNVSQMNIVSHPNLGKLFTQTALINQPSLSLNHFGTGINGIQYDGINKVITAFNNTYYKPNWNEPSYVAIKLTYQLDGNNFRQTLYYRSELVAGEKGLQISIKDNVADRNKVEVWMSAYHTASTTYKRKIVRFDDALIDGDDYIIIFQNPGTDDANDWTLTINGVPSSKTIISNESFIDSLTYPISAESVIRIGWNEAAGNYFKGFVGKIIDSNGFANIEAITSSLNSPI